MEKRTRPPQHTTPRRSQHHIAGVAGALLCLGLAACESLPQAIPDVTKMFETTDREVKQDGGRRLTQTFRGQRASAFFGRYGTPLELGRITEGLVYRLPLATAAYGEQPVGSAGAANPSPGRFLRRRATTPSQQSRYPDQAQAGQTRPDAFLGARERLIDDCVIDVLVDSTGVIQRIVIAEHTPVHYPGGYDSFCLKYFGLL